MPRNSPSETLLAVAPKWAQDVYKDHLPQKRLENLGRYSHCVVGEAWGFTHVYSSFWEITDNYCEICDDYAYLISATIDDDYKTVRHPTFLRKHAEEFAQHYKEVHAK